VLSFVLLWKRIKLIKQHLSVLQRGVNCDGRPSLDTAVICVRQFNENMTD
jgi:hypothetical protein